ncbi:division/cell wall cluster transcriptional repressor MraZ [Thiolapillus sp.]
MFLGSTNLNLDAKGRLAIPVKYRKDLVGPENSGVVVTVNPYERCLWLYPRDEWQEVARKVISLPDLKKQNKSLKRLLLGHASELELDSQGRILLSAGLRDYAGMSKPVALIGQGNKFEIWAEDAWLATRDDCLETVMPGDESELSEELASLAL